jgi:hypothetical protein
MKKGKRIAAYFRWVVAATIGKAAACCRTPKLPLFGLGFLFLEDSGGSDGIVVIEA